MPVSAVKSSGSPCRALQKILPPFGKMRACSAATFEPLTRKLQLSPEPMVTSACRAVGKVLRLMVISLCTNNDAQSNS